MPFAIGYQDYLANAVLSGGSWVSTLPLTNLQSGDLRQVARSTSLDAADTQFRVDLGAIRSIGMIAIGPINASPECQYRVRAYADSALTSLKYDSTLLTVESGTVIDWTDSNDWLEWEDPNFWIGIVPSEYADLPFYIVLTIPAASANDGQAQFWKIEIVDEGNPDGFIEIGTGALMRIFRPALNYAPDGNSSDLTFLQDMMESKGGRRTFSEIAIRRGARFSWPTITNDDAFDDFMRIGLLSRTSRRVFVVPEESESGDRLRLRAFPATFTKAPSIVQLAAGLGSTAYEFEEVI